TGTTSSPRSSTPATGRPKRSPAARRADAETEHGGPRLREAAGARRTTGERGRSKRSMDDYILEMRGITKTFPGVTALSDVNFAVRRGEIHAICGENGAGKSTLMKVLSGVHATGEYDGEIIYDGEPVRFSGIRDS